MEVKQKQQEKGYAIALYLDVFDFFDIKENVSVNLSEAKEHAQDFEVAVVLYILVGDFSAPLALFEAVVVVLELANDFGE